MGFLDGLVLCASPICDDATAGLEDENEREPDVIHWMSSYEEALSRARSRGRPVFIFRCAVGGCPSASRLLEDPDVRILARECLCLVADERIHATVRDPDSPERREICARYGTVTCEEHVRVADAVRTVHGPLREGPGESRFLVLDSKGASLFDRPLPEDPAPLRRTLIDALHRSAPKEFEGLQARLTRFRVRRFEAELKKSSSETARRAILRRVVETLDIDAVRILFDRFDEDSGDDGKGDRGAERTKGPIPRTPRSIAETSRECLVRFSGRPDFEEAVDWLVTLLNEQRDRLAREAAASLEAIGSERAVPALLDALKGAKDTVFRSRVIRALGTCGPGEPKVRKAILKHTKRRDPLLRGNALLALHRMKGYEAARLRALDALGDDEAKVRACAVWTLGWIGRLEDAARLKTIRPGFDGETRFVDVVNGALSRLEGNPVSAFDELLHELGGDPGLGR